MDSITFQAAIARVQTMADGGLRFTLDAPETEIMAAAKLMECKRFGVYLQVECRAAEAPQEWDKWDGPPS